MFRLLSVALFAPLLWTFATQVKAVKIVHLGDSYAAGNGGKNYEDLVCFRSANNWGNKLVDELENLMTSTFEYVNNACSGKLVSDLANQVNAVDSSTDLVLLGVGGNDLNFDDIVQQCYAPGFRDLATCNSKLNAAANALPSLTSSITSALLNIRSRNSDVKVVLVAYPHVSLDISYTLSDENITPLARSVGNQLDDAQQAAVDNANANFGPGNEFAFFYDETKTLFAGHEPHPSAISVNGNGWVWELIVEHIPEEVYHLNPTGHSELGRALAPFVVDILDLPTNAPALPPSMNVPPTNPPTFYADPSLVYCSQSRDLIQLDGGDEKQYSCNGGASGPVFLAWRTSPSGPFSNEGFDDDEYIIKLYQDGTRIYKSEEFFDGAGQTRLSGIVGSETRASSSFVVEFDCTLSFFDCDDGFFEFKLVECGCPNGRPPLQECVINSIDDTKNAVCSNEPPAPLPTSAPTPSSSGCFSPLARAEVQDQGPVFMKDLQVGDLVLTDKGYLPVYAFAHRHEFIKTNYLQLQYSAENRRQDNLEVTTDHLVYVLDIADNAIRPVPVRADSVQVGDSIVYQTSPNDDPDATAWTKVTGIGSVQRSGLYAPLTASSTIIVNGILASNYVGVQSTTPTERTSREELVILGGKVVTPLRQSQAIHLWFAPLRLSCSLLWSKWCNIDVNRSNNRGMLPYTELGLQLQKWFDAQTIWLQLGIFLLCLVLLGACYFVELVTIHCSSMALAILLGYWIFTKRQLPDKSMQQLTVCSSDLAWQYGRAVEQQRM